MNTETKTAELEIVSPDEKLVKYANQTGLEKTSALSLAEVFQPIFVRARQAIADAAGVAESVKDATCVKEIRQSRACRLALRAVRLESEATRKKQKEQALLYGRAVDGFHNILLADLSPVETALQEAEDIAERAEAARLAQLKMAREKELQPFLETPIMGDLSAISESDYTKMLADAKLLKQAKLDAIAKMESEVKAKAEADRAERERIATENARLKAEAEAREAVAKAEREEHARKLAEERAAADAAAKMAAEAARIERERLEAIAKESQRKLDEAQAAANSVRLAEEKKAVEAAAAAKKTAAAPDNAKAQALANQFRAIPLPQFTGHAWMSLPSRIEALAKWIEDQITN